MCIRDSLFPTFGVMPYGRWYFGGNWFSIASPNAGFLIEVNSAIGYYDKLKNVYYSGNWLNLERTVEIVSGTSFGIGLGAGFKYVTPVSYTHLTSRFESSYPVTSVPPSEVGQDVGAIFAWRGSWSRSGGWGRLDVRTF